MIEMLSHGMTTQDNPYEMEEILGFNRGGFPMSKDILASTRVVTVLDGKQGTYTQKRINHNASQDFSLMVTPTPCMN